MSFIYITYIFRPELLSSALSSHSLCVSVSFARAQNIIKTAKSENIRVRQLCECAAAQTAHNAHRYYFIEMFTTRDVVLSLLFSSSSFWNCLKRLKEKERVQWALFYRISSNATVICSLHTFLSVLIWNFLGSNDFFFFVYMKYIFALLFYPLVVALSYLISTSRNRRAKNSRAKK